MIELFKDAFEWLLSKGIITALLIVNGIYMAIMCIVLYIVHWWHKHH